MASKYEEGAEVLGHSVGGAGEGGGNSAVQGDFLQGGGLNDTNLQE